MDKKGDLDVIRKELVHRGYLGESVARLPARLSKVRPALRFGYGFGLAAGIGLALGAAVFNLLSPAGAVESALVALCSLAVHVIALTILGIVLGILIDLLVGRRSGRVDSLRFLSPLAGGAVSALVLLPPAWWAATGRPTATRTEPVVLVLFMAAELLAAAAAGWFVYRETGSALVRSGGAEGRGAWLRRYRLLAAAAAIAIGLVFVPPVWSGVGGRPDDVSGVPVRDGSPRVYLIGLDGFTPELAEELIGRGIMDNLRRLMAGAAVFRLRSDRPRPPAEVWTGVATGYPSSIHGVTSPFVFTADGLGRWFAAPGFPDPRWPVPPLLDVLGLVHAAPLAASDRRVDALWDIAGAAGLTVDLIDWWGTGPAEEVNGRVVSDGFRPRTGDGAAMENPGVHPRSLSGPLWEIQRAVSADSAPRAVRAAAASGASGLADAYRSDEFRFRTAGYFLKSGRADLTMLYLPGMDLIQRRFRRPGGLTHQLDLGTVEAYGKAVLGYASYLDARLGELLGAMPRGIVTVMVLYPGWSEIDWDRREPVPGLCLAAGDGIEPGRSLLPRSPESVAAAVLTLGGLPVAEDMNLEALTVPFSAEYLRNHPVRYWSGLGRRRHPGGPTGSDGSDEGYLARLRSFNYLTDLK